MSMQPAFEELKKAHQPIYAPESTVSWCKSVGSVSESVICINEDIGDLVYKGVHYGRRTVTWSVRENGAGAWGCGLTLEKDTFFRWLSSEEKYGGWNLTTKRQYITVASGGGSLEVISIEEDDTIRWVLNIFESI